MLSETLFSNYLLAIGDFDKNSFHFDSTSWDFYIYVLFVCGSLLSNFVIINLMIALAGDVFDRMSLENKEVITLKKKVFFLADYVFDKNLANKGGAKLKYTFALIPKTEKGIKTWEGKMQMLKDLVEDSVQEQK